MDKIHRNEVVTTVNYNRRRSNTLIRLCHKAMFVNKEILKKYIKGIGNIRVYSVYKLLLAMYTNQAYTITLLSDITGNRTNDLRGVLNAMLDLGLAKETIFMQYIKCMGVYKKQRAYMLSRKGEKMLEYILREVDAI